MKIYEHKLYKNYAVPVTNPNNDNIVYHIYKENHFHEDNLIGWMKREDVENTGDWISICNLSDSVDDISNRFFKNLNKFK